MIAIVVDACAVVDALVEVPAPRPLIRAIADAGELHVPEHFHLEVISALRGLQRSGQIAELNARDGLARVAALRVLRHPVLEIHRDIWALRHNLTAYDAAYLALARRLDLPLLTTDRVLAEAAQEDGRLLSPA